MQQMSFAESSNKDGLSISFSPFPFMPWLVVGVNYFLPFITEAKVGGSDEQNLYKATKLYLYLVYRRLLLFYLPMLL